MQMTSSTMIRYDWIKKNWGKLCSGMNWPQKGIQYDPSKLDNQLIPRKESLAMVSTKGIFQRDSLSPLHSYDNTKSTPKILQQISAPQSKWKWQPPNVYRWCNYFSRKKSEHRSDILNDSIMITIWNLG